MDQLPQQLLIGLSIGATYALIALGYTMVYGVLRLINFAHGEIYMVGAISGYYFAQGLEKAHAPLWLALPVTFLGAMVVCAIVGFLIEFLAYRPLRRAPRLVSLITAIGVSLLLQNLAQLQFIFGPTPRYFPTAVYQAVAPQLDLLTLGLSLALMTVLSWVVLRTRTGMALRAVSFRFDTASLMGINTDRIISFTFMMGSSLAAVAGVLDGIRYTVQPLMGLNAGLKAFIAAVLGGIGSIPGALVGGLIIGLLETLLKGVVLRSSQTGLADAFVFATLILILLIRPTGLFGRRTVEKL